MAFARKVFPTPGLPMITTLVPFWRKSRSSSRRCGSGIIEELQNRVPPDVEVACDSAVRPLLDQGQTMDFVDLFRAEHASLYAGLKQRTMRMFFSRRGRRRTVPANGPDDQQVGRNQGVLYKIPGQGANQPGLGNGTL